MFDFVEPRVRRLVADHLGVGTEELTRDVSLADELAVDSLDLVELALALEAEFGISLSEATLDGVRTYGELADAVCILARLRREAELGAERAKEPLIWARVVLPQSHGSSELQRAGWLTPYTAETIAEDALRGGRGTRLEVSVSSTVSDDGLARLVHQFAWLGDRGVQVNVHRDTHLGAHGNRTHPHAAA
jgi:acyl carrier protein